MRNLYILHDMKRTKKDSESLETRGGYPLFLCSMKIKEQVKVRVDWIGREQGDKTIRATFSYYSELNLQ